MKTSGILKIIKAVVDAAMAIISLLTGKKKKGGDNGDTTKGSKEQ